MDTPSFPFSLDDVHDLYPFHPFVYDYWLLLVLEENERVIFTLSQTTPLPMSPSPRRPVICQNPVCPGRARYPFFLLLLRLMHNPALLSFLAAPSPRFRTEGGERGTRFGRWETDGEIDLPGPIYSLQPLIFPTRSFSLSPPPAFFRAPLCARVPHVHKLGFHST